MGKNKSEVRPVNLPSELLDSIGLVARVCRKTSRQYIIDTLEEHLKDKYPNLDQAIAELQAQVK